MERLSDTAIEIINDLHTERLEYTSEYIPLIDSANKLAEYEDLEEQGLLLRLPIKIGDTVYYIASKPEDNYLILSVEEGIILKVEIFEKEMEIWVKELNGMCIYGLEDLKECVFLTKEEAEAKLREMEVGE